MQKTKGKNISKDVFLNRDTNKDSKFQAPWNIR